MSNSKQKAFLKNLLKTIEQAKASQSVLLQGIAIGVSNREACVEYVQALQQYIHDAERMVMQCTIAFGEGPDRIAIEATLNRQSNN